MRSIRVMAVATAVTVAATVASTVAVTASSVVGADSSVEAVTGAIAGAITGTVTGPGGAPVEGVRVYAELVPYSRAEGHQAEAVTGSDGRYHLGGLASGRFSVTFEPAPTSPLVPERYDDEHDFTGSGEPVLVTVTDAVTTSGIDARLALGYSISGRVTDTSGAPLAGVKVGVYERSFTLVGHGNQGEALTDAAGTYRVDRLVPGAYRVGFSKVGWISELYDDTLIDKDHTPVVIVDRSVTGVDAALEPSLDTLFQPLVPARLLDTRSGLGAGVAGRVGGGSVFELSVGGRGGVPVDASAAVLNVTVTEPVGAGFVTVFPCGEVMPTASSVNFVAGETVANAVVATLGVAGAVCVFTNVASHLVVDVNGAFPA
jgi:hypothetical protein